MEALGPSPLKKKVRCKPIRVFQRLFRWPCLIPKIRQTANGGSSWNSLGSQDDILEDTKCSKGGLFEQFGRISTLVGSVVTGDGRFNVC